MTSALRLVRGALPERVRERGRLVAAWLLEARQRRSAAVRGAAIVLHAVGPRPGEPRLELDPPLEATRLDRAVRYLSSRYRIVTAAELPAAARGRVPGSRLPIALTFDDDLPSHRSEALPVLRRHHAAATAFICGAREPFWWQLLQAAVDGEAITAADLPHLEPGEVERALRREPGGIGRVAKAIEDLPPAERDEVAAALARSVSDPPALLDSEGAAELVAAGWEIGAHTPGHYLLTTLDRESLRRELEPRPLSGSGELPRTLAYPHGKATDREADAARLAGYSAAFTGYPRVLTEATDDHLIGRLQPDTATPGRFALSLARALSEA
jgi:peptidoglycan/xylan/chitin deacetylase (PgdA/CDA1 family)